MKLLLCLLLVSASLPSFAQMSLQEVEDAAILKRIEYVKAKTDSLIFTGFKKDIRAKFSFEFAQGGYVNGERPYNYVFLNADKHMPDEIYNVNHSYSFEDTVLKLSTNMDVYYFEKPHNELRFKSTADVLRFTALQAIYNDGLINKIKATIKEQKIKQPYTVIEVSSKLRKYFIYLKDKASTHTYLIS